MSVRFNSTTDSLRSVGFTALTIGTGTFSFAQWMKLISDVNARCDIALLNEAVGNDSPFLGTEIATDGTTLVGRYAASVSNIGALSVGTWYWVVRTRTGTTQKGRVFNEAGTKIHDVNISTLDGNDYTTLDCLLLGDAGLALRAFDGEMQNVKVHTGVAWDDAQCVTESATYGIQMPGGANRLCWKLTDIDADTDGINEIAGAGPNLTNSGCITGASEPSPLVAATSWGAQLSHTHNRLVQG